MKHYCVYLLSNGQVLRTGTCLDQDFERQADPAKGEAVIEAAHEVITVAEVNIAPIKEHLAAQIDAEAEAFRLRFITPGAGQAITYLRKEQEAAAYLADSGASVPLLEAEAAVTGVTVTALAAEVAAASAQWLIIGTAIEARRRQAKIAVQAATNVAEAHAAAIVDWAALLP